MGSTLDILKDFPPVTKEEWRAKVEADLKGKPFEKLIKKTYEGIDIQPLYLQEDLEGLAYVDSQPGEAPFVRGIRASGAVSMPWQVSQELRSADPAEWNKTAKHALQKGQTSLNIVLDEATQNGFDADNATAETAGRDGLSLNTLADAELAFRDIDLTAQECRLATGPSGLAATALLAAQIQAAGQDAAKLRGSISADPLGTLARTGTLPMSLERAYAHLAALTRWAAATAPNLRTITVDASAYQESGGSAVQDIASALATGAEYLHELDKRGIAAETAARHINFEFAIGSDLFMEIAKFRAARLCWSQVVESFGGSEPVRAMHIHARTSRWNKTKVDPWVNMLRVSTETLSAVAGGVDSIHVGPYDEIFRAPNEFSSRIARNVHIVLREEAHFDKVVDPAGGCWYVEQLTQQLADRAWALFQQIEGQGGMFKALSAGFPQAQVAEVAAKRAKNVATRTDRFVGTSMYPNLAEAKQIIEPIDHEAFLKTRKAALAAARKGRSRDAALAEVGRQADSGQEALMTAAIAAARVGASLGEIFAAARGQEAAPQVNRLRVHRGAEPFERIRMATEAWAERHGGAPKIFMANMGPIPQHKARTDFSTAFLNVAALATIANDGFPTIDEAVNAALDSGARAMVICSTDDSYPEIVPELTRKVKAARPDMMVILAGYPKDQIEAFKAAGVDEFLHVRANALDLLTKVQQHLEVI